MTLSRQTLILAAAGGSAALLAGAFVFQALGYAPCQLCIWQRWPHGIAVAIGVAALWSGAGWLAPLGALAALVTGGIGVFHAGVEYQWWEGLQACTVNALEGLSSGDLLDTNLGAGGPVRCDRPAWVLFGISMAGWNALISAGLAALWLAAARRPG